MHKTLYKWIAAAAVICCLLSGCGGNSTETGGPDTSPDVSGAGDDLSGLFDDNSPTIEIGGFSYGWPDERDVFTYSGEPLEIPFYLTGAMDFSQEIGLLIFVDGIAQPYSAVFPDGTKKAEAYMQVFELEKAAENRFNLVFQPVTGKTGDSLSIQAVTILSPSYMPAGTKNPSYGIYHSENLTLPLQIAYEADAPAENKRTATDKYDITDIPKSVTDTNAYFDMDTLDTVNYLSIVPADGEDNSILYSQDGFATFKIMLYGGPEADNNITVFVNHQPVQLGGADYLAVRTVKGKMVEATITLDVSSFGKLNTLYAIASSTGRDSDLTETRKSDSILMVNQEAK
jgi:hypothetical protein|nr:hypothetical protein [uncultured Acetatifactor sp.]